jgi:hypothetical protein
MPIKESAFHPGKGHTLQSVAMMLGCGRRLIILPPRNLNEGWSHCFAARQTALSGLGKSEI